MTSNPADENPASSAGSQLPVVGKAHVDDSSGDAVPTEGGGRLSDRKAKRSRKRALKKEMEAKLGHWSFFSEHDPNTPIRLVVEGEHIGADSGDGEAIGLMIVRLSKLFSSLGGRPQLQSLAFGSSVTIDFRAPDSEGARAEKQLEEARRLSDAAGGSPSYEQAGAIESALRGALTDVVVAAELAADLLSVSSTDAPEVAGSFGGQVAGAYKTLANAVSQAQVTLIIEAPSHERTQLTPTKAARVAEALRTSTEARELTIKAFGTLSLANQEQHGFGLRLDRDAARHEVLKGKRVVNGIYLPEVETKIRDHGLWGREVRATLRVVRDELISTSAIRPPTFTLIDVEPRNPGV
jgi:hypothetical protein